MANAYASDFIHSNDVIYEAIRLNIMNSKCPELIPTITPPPDEDDLSTSTTPSSVDDYFMTTASNPFRSSSTPSAVPE